MPIEQRNTSTQMRSLSIALAVLAAAIALTAVFFRTATADKPATTVGASDEFVLGQATRISSAIAKDGPLLFSDVSGRGQLRPVYVNHLGSDPASGWVAFEAKAPGTADDCFLRWSAKAERFESRDADDRICADDTFDPSGEGLKEIPTELQDATGATVTSAGTGVVLVLQLGTDDESDDSAGPSATTTAG